MPHPGDEEPGKEWYVLGAGLLSAIFAIATYFVPAESHIAAATWLGAFAVFFFVVFAFAPPFFCRGVAQVLAVVIDVLGWLVLFFPW
jgi:hypothetical protein